MPIYKHHIALLGGGTIGLSMTALHLRRPDTTVTIYDPRPDFEAQLRNTLPTYLDPSQIPTPEEKDENLSTLLSTRLTLATTIQQAVQNATIIQEQSPEVTASKQALWQEVTKYTQPDAHLWSSSSGIAASAQSALCSPDVVERLLVAHPFNPPHVMPLVEIVPGPGTRSEEVEFVQRYFEGVPGPGSSGEQYYRPIVLHKEITGFVGNRLAFALLREACYLVGEGVVSVKDLDALVMASLGPRWAGSGVFESYHAGGGEGGIGGFLEKLAPTLGNVWGQLGAVDIDGEQDGTGALWREAVVRQAEEAYGPSMLAEERRKKEVMTKGIVEMQKRLL
ncbi:Dehydrogenase multihelical [Penicillium longicatenatum]|uniref:Dehydrogenase multihelical n=1 Tax=Penicillium longicatenatum TaxID=1561947 RepID=UPI0025486547|nr:Dehydrogenase multihelical [Penicillium longicatenatum]KAJ5658611.1 Dehydrogenase multihelical [Penicillium longicatenatum]